MKRTIIFLALMFLGCTPDRPSAAANLSCEVMAFDGARFLICRSIVHGGAVVSVAPVCK